MPNSIPASVFSFVRQNATDKVCVFINFSDQTYTAQFKENLYHGKYTDYLGGEMVELDAASRLELKPLSYRIFVK